MKRHSSLIPLSHDHHHALSEARRLRRAAEGDTAARRAAVASFLRFFSEETVRHFREEEERLFPALVDAPDPAEELVVQALLDHQHLRALVARLDCDLAAGDAGAELMRELAERLENHIRLEERRLFPLAQEAVPGALDKLDLAAERSAEDPVVDLLGPLGRGPLWGAETDDFNATLPVWGAGEGTPEHVNAECDVLMLVLAGSAAVTLDGDSHTVHTGDVVIVEKGRTRQIAAGPEGVRYLSVHLRRGPLRIASAPTEAA